jgi:hypothetical protein
MNSMPRWDSGPPSTLHPDAVTTPPVQQFPLLDRRVMFHDSAYRAKRYLG